MLLWLGVALGGLVLSALGFVFVLRRYREARLRLRTLLALAGGYLALLAYALLSALRPELMTGPVTLVVMLPAFVAIVVLVQDRQDARGPGGAGGW